MELSQMILKPVISEKSFRQASLGGYTFGVAKEATKSEIKKAVETQFKVKVTAIRTIKMPEKTRRVGSKRRPVKKPGFKKAIVYLASGQKLDFFEVGQEKE